MRRQDIAGDDVTKAIRLKLRQQGRCTPASRRERHLARLALRPDDRLRAARLGGGAAEAAPGRQDQAVSVPNERPSPFLFAIPALIALLGLAVHAAAPARFRPSLSGTPTALRRLGGGSRRTRAGLEATSQQWSPA